MKAHPLKIAAFTMALVVLPGLGLCNEGQSTTGGASGTDLQPTDESALLAEASVASKQFATLLPSLVNNPRQAVAAALLLQGDESRTADRNHWLAYARSRGAHDPLVQMVLGTQLARRAGSKQPGRAALERLQALEPDNAYVWLLTMNLETGARNSVPTALRRAGQATSYDNHWRELERELYQLAKHWPMSPRMQADLAKRQAYVDPHFIHARGVMSALWIPGFHRLSEACRQPDESALADCKHVAGFLLDDGRNLLEQQLGIAMMKRLETEPGLLADIEERSRVLHWRLASMAEFNLAPHNLAGQRELLVQSPEDVADLMENGEQAVLLRALEREGLPAFPPGDWNPASP